MSSSSFICLIKIEREDVIKFAIMARRPQETTRLYDATSELVNITGYNFVSNHRKSKTYKNKLSHLIRILTVLKVKRVAIWTKLCGVLCKRYPNDLENFIIHSVLRTWTYSPAANISYLLKALKKVDQLNIYTSIGI